MIVVLKFTLDVSMFRDEVFDKIFSEMLFRVVVRRQRVNEKYFCD